MWRCCSGNADIPCVLLLCAAVGLTNRRRWHMARGSFALEPNAASVRYSLASTFAVFFMARIQHNAQFTVQSDDGTRLINNREMTGG